MIRNIFWCAKLPLYIENLCKYMNVVEIEIIDLYG